LFACLFEKLRIFVIIQSVLKLRRWWSGLSQQTVNLSPFGLRWFESNPAHTHKRATLAQLVERHFCKVDVVSSSLTGGSELEQLEYLE
jgi:hypothetical protein